MWLHEAFLFLQPSHTSHVYKEFVILLSHAPKEHSFVVVVVVGLLITSLTSFPLALSSSLEWHPYPGRLCVVPITFHFLIDSTVLLVNEKACDFFLFLYPSPDLSLSRTWRNGALRFWKACLVFLSQWPWKWGQGEQGHRGAHVAVSLQKWWNATTQLRQKGTKTEW